MADTPNSRDDDALPFTDVVFSIPGRSGLDDPRISKILEATHTLLEAAVDDDVLLASHVSGEAGEAYHSVVAERDALQAELAEARRAHQEVLHEALRYKRQATEARRQARGDGPLGDGAVAELNPSRTPDGHEQEASGEGHQPG